MKKIVALVLSLVMALSLCTVAFAAEKYPYDIFDKDEQDRYTVDSGVNAKFVKADYDKEEDYGWVDYYEDENGYNYAIVTEKDADDPMVFAIQVDKKTVYIKNIGNTVEAGMGEIFYNVAAKKVDKVYKWNCETGVHAAGYLDDDNYLYVKAEKKDNWSYNPAEGAYAVLAGDTIVKVFMSGDVKPGSHVLTKVGDTDNKQVKKYECVVCGKQFYGTQDPAVAKVEDPNFFGYDANAVVDAVKGYVDAPEFTKLVTDEYLYIWAVDGKDATKDNTGITSPKTFDAGIAMYVGMSLLSVAGGAVVIGKKKEF